MQAPADRREELPAKVWPDLLAEESGPRGEPSVMILPDTAGENSRTAKLKASDVREIRRRRAAGEKCDAIAPDFGISSGMVAKISRRHAWRSLPEEPR